MVFPSPKESDVVVDSYNSTLAMHRMIELFFSGFVNIFQNEAIYGICKRKMGIDHPTYRDINELIAASASAITCGLRFPGELNSNIRKQAVT